MTESEWIRLGILYFPLILALIAGLLRRGQTKVFAACLLSMLWTAPALLVLQKLNMHFGWWSYNDYDFAFSGMPLELYFGWTILWGILPQLAFQRLPIWICAAFMALLDLGAMPLCNPVVQLSSRWLIGEGIAILIVLLPALCIARWTVTNRYLRARAGFQVVIAAVLFLYFLPELIFAISMGSDWQGLLSMTSWRRQIALQLLALLSLPALGAVMEFAERGVGTPIPYDPPQYLVTSGIYRYCANPMQLSCSLLLLGWGLLIKECWYLLAPITAIIYSIGIARWDEAQNLSKRFGAAWREYRMEVRNWFPRWKPYHAGTAAQLYIAATCKPCSQLRSWIEARGPIGLNIFDAESFPSGSIRRMRYVPEDHSAPVEGIRAFARSLEHLNLGWAVVGIALRLPLLWQLVQSIADASGFGPRTLVHSTQCEK